MLAPSRKRLYKEFLDEQNYKIAMTLARKLPSGMSIQELREVTGLAWTPTKYHVMRLMKASLVKRIGNLYKIRSRALFEYGLLETVFSGQDGVERLADALEESMKEHEVPTDRMLVMNLANFTAHCVEHLSLIHISEPTRPY